MLPIIRVYQDYPDLLRVPNKDIWTRVFANKLFCLSHGVGTRMPTNNNTIFFIAKTRVPSNRKFTYSGIVADIRPIKEETHQMEGTDYIFMS